jgi:hypothetical protein
MSEPAPEIEPDTFPRSYVEELRAEAAEHRLRAKEADRLRDALRTAVLARACDGILHDPLPWSDDFDGEDGLPDPEKVREAAEGLAAEKPHLARVRGDAGQGFRGDESDAVVDLAELLRNGA